MSLNNLNDAPIVMANNYALIEEEMLNQQQVDCPVLHHFGPGTYIREVTLPAGTFALGHHQKYAQLNVMLTGVINSVADDGSIKVLTAPMIFVGPPGRKMGYVVETCTWLNIFPNPEDERDIDKLEDIWLDKSEAWKESEKSNLILNEEDKSDFYQLLADYGFTEDTAREQSENEHDQIQMPDAFSAKISVRNSNIDGKGLFASAPVNEGELIAPARISGMRTSAGRYTNHSKNPNAKFVMLQNGDINLVATKNISGCVGGSQGDEITVDYRQALSLSGVLIKNEVET